MTVDIARAADTAAHDGVRYWFCAGGCRRRFEAEPQRFVAP
jgi:Cu+-exporting ATPase